MEDVTNSLQQRILWLHKLRGEKAVISMVRSGNPGMCLADLKNIPKNGRVRDLRQEKYNVEWYILR